MRILPRIFYCVKRENMESIIWGTKCHKDKVDIKTKIH